MTHSRHNPLTLWRRHLGVQMVAILFAVSVGFGVASHHYDYESEVARAREDLLRDARLLVRTAAMACPDAVLTLDNVLQDYVENLTSDVRHVLFARVERSSDGAVLASTPGADPREADEDVLVVSAPIRVGPGGDEIGRFVIGVWLHPMQQALAERATGMFWRSLGGSLLVALVMWMVVRLLMTRRLTRLDRHAQQLASGDLQRALPDLGSSELGRLAATLENMRRNLQRSRRSLEQQNQQLLELNQLKSEFLANMSHELQTPLTGILGGLELLDGGDLTPAEQADWLQTMQRNGAQLHEMLNTILDLSKIEAGNLLMETQQCVPQALIDEVVQRYREPAAAQGLELVATATSDLEVAIHTDPARVRQVLGHVIGNAIKFTERGRIAIDADIRTVNSRRMLVITVLDSGIGMTPEFLAKACQPFTQADGSLTRRCGGSGLGLAISRRLAIELGGDLDIQSDVDVGTRVTVTIAAPLATEQDGCGDDSAAATKRDPAAGSAAADAPATLRGHVLLVDDAADNRKLLTAMLKRAGVDVEVACDGQQAIDAVEARRSVGQPFDLVLMDLQMPVLDGISAIACLRARGDQVPIVAITAHAMVEDRDRCMAVGGDGYETKPIHRPRLLQVLERFLPSADDQR